MSDVIWTAVSLAAAAGSAVFAFLTWRNVRAEAAEQAARTARQTPEDRASK